MNQGKTLLWEMAASGLVKKMLDKITALPVAFRASNPRPHIFVNWLVIETMQADSLQQPVPTSLARQIVDMVENYEFDSPNIRADFTPPAAASVTEKDIVCAENTTKLDSNNVPHKISLWSVSSADGRTVFTKTGSVGAVAAEKVTFKAVAKGTYVLAADDGNSLPSNFLTVL